MLLLFCLNPWSTLCPNNLNICIKTEPVTTGVSLCLAFEYILYSIEHRNHADIYRFILFTLFSCADYSFLGQCI